MEIEKTASCCGVGDCIDLPSSPEKFIYEIWYQAEYADEKYALFFFGDTVSAQKQSNGSKIAKFLVDKKLGSVKATTIRKNPNSGNKLRAYLYIPNWRAIKNFIKDNKKEFNEEYGTDNYKRNYW